MDALVRDRPSVRVPADVLFRQVVQHGPVALLVLGASGHIVLASAEAIRLLGWDPKGHPFANVFEPRRRPAVQAYLRDLAGPAPDPALVRPVFTVELLDLGGRRPRVEVAGRSLSGGPGGPIVVIALRPRRDATGEDPRPPGLGSQRDALTGLPDRAVLFDHLEAACRRRPPRGSVVVVGLDVAPAGVGADGAARSEELARIAAGRLSGAAPDDVLVVRLAGDDFVLLFADGDPSSAAPAVERILRAVAGPVPEADPPVVLRVAAGMAAVDGEGSDPVLRRAEAALAVAIDGGWGGVAVHEPSMPLPTGDRWDLAATVARLERERARLAFESRTDALTGLPNARALQEAMLALGDQPADHRPLSVLFVDLDRFGAYNKHQGDASGDAALRLVASAVAASCREGDTAYRKGGEEIVLLLPRTPHGAAVAIGERLRCAVRDLEIPHGGHPDTPTLTVTVGVATSGLDDGVEQVQAAAADAALRSKSAERRNRTVSAGG